MPWHGTKWSNCPGKDWMVQESNPGHLRHRPAVLPRHPRKDSPEGSTFRRKKMIKFASHQVPINFIFLASAKVEKIHFLTQIFRFNFCVRCVTAVTRINLKPVFGKKIFLRIFFAKFLDRPQNDFFDERQVKLCRRCPWPGTNLTNSPQLVEQIFEGFITMVTWSVIGANKVLMAWSEASKLAIVLRRVGLWQFDL